MVYILKKVLLFCSCLSLLCLVAGKDGEATETNCQQTLTQTDMNQCASEDGQKADVELEVIYRALSQKLEPLEQAKLDAAKAAWMDYRAKQCEFNSSGTQDGSVHPMIINDCYENLTNDYIQLLDAQLHCEEGNLSCVH